jgi:exonuclease SbcC
MRPERLELSGFGAFLEPTVVDFDGVDLFALVGPTGAGKSTILDAIAFALYGSVARYENPALVGPVVAARRAEARVRLDFSVAGVRHTAVRVVKRTARGASTRDARLERGDEVLAADPRGLTQEVERLLGLSFDDFTKCVILPQGAFARFLHDKPAVRQEVLIGLLGLSVYDQVRSLAVGRQKAAEQQAGVLDGRLGDLADATEDAVAAARARVEALGSLEARVAEAEPGLEAAAAEQRRLLEAAGTAETRAQRLSAVKAPAGVADLAGTLATARSELEHAVQAETAAAEVAALAARRLAEAGDRREAERALAALSLLEGLTTARSPLAAVAAEATERRVRAADATAAARQAAAEAREHLHLVQQAHRAAALAAELAVGGPCPVCEQPVLALPATTAPEDFNAARTALDQTQAGLDRAEQEATGTDRAAAAAEATLSAHDRQLAEAAAAASDDADRSRAEATLAAVAAAEADKAAAVTAETRARALVAATRRRFEQARDAVDVGWTAFDRARDTLGGLDPPAPTRADLGADWALLAAWSAARVPAERQAAERARRAAADAELLAAERQSALAGLLAAHDVALRPGQEPGAAVASATGQAETEARQMIAALEQATGLRHQLDAVRAQAGTARLLAVHLDAGHFEKWLLREALDDLVEGATTTLRQLSGGAYSLTCDDRLELSVIDHANADERRPVRTLSGGETFLASLSLALALADRIAALAPGQVALESLFLDEGFGTLDPDTLDVVASAIEQLGAEGRMVGLVTHVRELAERVPTRYEVAKGPGGATIERVTA